MGGRGEVEEGGREAGRGGRRWDRGGDGRERGGRRRWEGGGGDREEEVGGRRTGGCMKSQSAFMKSAHCRRAVATLTQASHWLARGARGAAHCCISEFQTGSESLVS